jgi:hypothetical protein
MMAYMIAPRSAEMMETVTMVVVRVDEVQSCAVALTADAAQRRLAGGERGHEGHRDLAEADAIRIKTLRSPQ